MDEPVNEKDLVKHLAGLTDAVERLGLNRAPGSASNGNVVRIEGAGSIWNGIAIGIALGAVIAGSVAVMAYLQQMNLRVQQSEAYQAALYMTSPRLAEAVEQDLDKRLERQENMYQAQKNSP